MAVTIGSKLGSYEVTELLGTGGMGEVYKARDATTRQASDVPLTVVLNWTAGLKP